MVTYNQNRHLERQRTHATCMNISFFSTVLHYTFPWKTSLLITSSSNITMTLVIQLVFITSIFISISSFRRYLPPTSCSFVRHCSSSSADKETVVQKPLKLQKHTWGDFEYTSHIVYGYGFPHRQFQHDPLRDGILGTCKLCGIRYERSLMDIEHPSIVHQPFEWIQKGSKIPQGRKFERGRDGRIVDTTDRWYGLQERVFLNETYYIADEGYRSNGTELLNKIMQDNAHGIRSAWENIIERKMKEYLERGIKPENGYVCAGNDLVDPSGKEV